MPNASQTPQTPAQDLQTGARQTIIISDVEYYLDSLGEEQQKAFAQAMEIQQSIKVKQVEIRNMNYAHQYLHDFIARGIETYEVVPVAETTEDGTESEAE